MKKSRKLFLSAIGIIIVISVFSPYADPGLRKEIFKLSLAIGLIVIMMWLALHAFRFCWTLFRPIRNTTDGIANSMLRKAGFSKLADFNERLSRGIDGSMNNLRKRTDSKTD